MKRMERNMIILTIFLLVALVVKSVFFDEVKNLSGEKETYKQFAQYAVEEKYKGALEQYGIIQFRIVDVSVVDNSAKTSIKYTDNNGKTVEKSLNSRYSATARKYFCGFFPIGQVKITTNVPK